MKIQLKVNLKELKEFYNLRTCVFGQKILKDTLFSF